jgi:hypothetical protein
MLFDKKIKYLIEVLGDQQTIAGYQAVDMDEEKIKNSMVEFNKTFDPLILQKALNYADSLQGLNKTKGKDGEEIEVKNIHIKFPFRNGSPKWIALSELRDAVKKKYFTKTSKDYIEYPLTKDGTLPNNRTFQSIMEHDKHQKPSKYPKLHSHPTVWLDILQTYTKGMEASDIRQEVNTETGERNPVHAFFYFTMKNGKLVPKKGRVSVRPDGTISATPFAGAFPYKNNYGGAYTPKGQYIDYKDIKGGLQLAEFEKRIFAQDAKKAAQAAGI